MLIQWVKRFTGLYEIPMIAALMTGRKFPARSYGDLARGTSAVRGTLTAADLPRLSAALESLADVKVDLAFELNASARPRVTGTASASVEAECQWCLEPVALTLTSEIDALIAVGEQQAQAWWADDQPEHMVVVASEQLDVAALVEDELLTALPSQLCVDATCERRPPVVFGPDADAEAPIEDNRQRPFAAALAGLKDAPASGTDT